jgi:hypothetical protein
MGREFKFDCLDYILIKYFKVFNTKYYFFLKNSTQKKKKSFVPKLPGYYSINICSRKEVNPWTMLGETFIQREVSSKAKGPYYT